jgi:hypothetical protein
MKDIIIKQFIDFKDASYNMDEEEFDTFLLMFASLVSLIYDKELKPTLFFSCFIDNPKLQNLLLIISGQHNIYHLTQKILFKYPNLCRSKIIKKKVKNFRLRNERRRKKLL